MKYTAPLTNRLLIESGYAYQRGDYRVSFQPANPSWAIARWDLLTGIVDENHYLSASNTEKKQEAKASVSYVTGSHNFKVGFENRWASQLRSAPFNGDISIRYTRNNEPYLAQVVNGPARALQLIHFDGGAYVQDQWRLKRFTFNLGVRWDRFNAGVPAQSSPAGFFVPAVTIGEIRDIPNWNDWATRTGVAWDVFGTGKTALKAFAGRFVAGHALFRTSQFNPIYSTSDQRSWTDLNGDGTVINHDGTPQFAEIGQSFNTNFGTLLGTDKLDPNLRRDKNWVYEVTAQHELMSRVSVNAGYYRRRYFDLAWTDNLATCNTTKEEYDGVWRRQGVTIGRRFNGPGHGTRDFPTVAAR